jgi:hypothetical protein
VNNTTRDLLNWIARYGSATVLNSRTRELHAALDLIKDGICYRSQTFPEYFIIKFGTKETS